VIFIHDCPDGIITDGVKAIDGRQFYLRLAQRIVHLFSTRTASGVLYELDTRLRPSGSSGMLATTLEGFLQYQSQEAWVWEHQALVRARVIYGDEIITKGFDKARHQVLTEIRAPLELKEAIGQMREKMRMNLNKNAASFHIKLDKGGITDIEFLTQFWVLNFSHAYPELTKWSDNIRILEQLGALNLVPAKEVSELIEAYIAFRDMTHRLNLKDLKLAVSCDRFKTERQNVQRIWDLWLG
jgi:glutamate-ammonia-ligase adenylyltransferase